MQSDKHISKSFDQDLDEAIRLFLYMGDSAANQVAKAIHALIDKDETLAQEVIDMDFDINRMEVELDEHILLLVAKRQPAASDLRLVIAISKVVNDLERIGDEADKIASQALGLSEQGQSPRGMVEIRMIGDHVGRMVRDALDAFARLDSKKALEVAQEDKLVDAEYSTAMRSLVTHMMEDPRSISPMLNVMWSLRSLERVGDHARNIAEHVIYLVKGADVRHVGLTEMARQVHDQ